MFFCQVLQYSITIVLLKKLKPLKKPLFQKRRWSCDFLPRKTPVAQKHRAISRQEKMAFSTPRRVVLGLPSPSRRVCADVRTYRRSRDYYVTTKISRKRLPNLLRNGAPLVGAPLLITFFVKRWNLFADQNVVIIQATGGHISGCDREGTRDSDGFEITREGR